MKLQRDGSGKGELSKEHFVFDVERDVYICPIEGQELRFWRVDAKRPGYKRRAYRCPRKDCPHRASCTKSKRMARVIKQAPHEAARSVQRARQSTPLARNALELRKQIVEHVFGNIKSGDGLKRFTVRGVVGARAQWALACTALNLRKLYAQWISGAFQLPAPTC